AGRLRKRVGRVAAGKHGGDARGSQQGVVVRDGGEACDGFSIGRLLGHGAKVGGGLAGEKIGCSGKVVAGDFVDLRGEGEALETVERGRNVIDGVIAGRNGAVAAGVEGFQLKVDVNLFAGLDGGAQALVAAFLELATVEVDAVLGVDQVAVILQQPVDAIVVAALFVGGEGENQVAIGSEIFFFQAHETGNQDGVALFH